MPVTQEMIVGVSKQIFILEYLINGLFPCTSDIVRLIRARKRDWKYNDKFEYRMLLAHTNSSGSLNSQTYNKDVSLIRPGNIDLGIFRATYGTVTDGITVDMMRNLETADKRAAFEQEYAVLMHSLRNNVASSFKNFAIHGQWGVVHQIRASILAPTVPAGYNPQPNVFTPVLGVPFTIKVPINVFQSNFKSGRMLIKTTTASPYGAADVAELYLVLDNQPGWLSLLPIGTAVSQWQDGQFLEVAQNREIVGAPANIFANWTYGAINVATGPYAGTYDQFAGTGAYTSGDAGVIGAMEGLADLFPWYTDPANPNMRLGTEIGFRDQPNRLLYTTEQCGGWVVQQPNEHIIDAIMRGAFLTKATVPYADVGVWMNPVTRIQMGYEEADNMRVLRDNFVQGPIVWQRGTKTTDYQIGNQVVREVVEDLNMPTDVILIGPKDDMSYNCWDSTIFKIDDYIQQLWSSSPPPKIEDISIPDEFISSLDLSNLMTVGAPSVADGVTSTFTYGNRIRHPRNSIPVAMHEMGALFTEHPYSYTVVKLLNPIADITTV